MNTDSFRWPAFTARALSSSAYTTFVLNWMPMDRYANSSESLAHRIRGGHVPLACMRMPAGPPTLQVKLLSIGPKPAGPGVHVRLPAPVCRLWPAAVAVAPAADPLPPTPLCPPQASRRFISRPKSAGMSLPLHGRAGSPDHAVRAPSRAGRAAVLLPSGPSGPPRPCSSS